MKDYLELYPLGYIFSEEKISECPKYFSKRKILKYYYYFDNNTSQGIYQSGDFFIIIHGNFKYIGLQKDIDNEDLPRILLTAYENDYERFLNYLDFITGRFTIIIGDYEHVAIYPDATNARSNYYSLDRLAVSSHLDFLATVFNYETNEFVEEDLKDILLETQYSQIKSTIPNHFTDLTTKRQKRFFPREQNQYTKLSEEERFEIFEDIWKKQMDYYFNEYEDIIFSLTGGGDSRFSLAMLKEYKHRVQFFTYALYDREDYSTSTAKNLSLDYAIVKQILSDIDLDHRYFFFEDDPKLFTEEEEEVVSRNNNHNHNPQLILYTIEYLGKQKFLHFRANLLEIGQTYLFRNEYKSNNLEETRKAFLKLYKVEGDENRTDLLSRKFYRFCEDVKFGEDIYDYHLIDLLYWEVRLGRWICEVSNNHDNSFNTINPFNHRALIEISLSFSYEKRRDEWFFKQLINRKYPILNFYGDNTLKNLFEQKSNINTLKSNRNKDNKKTLFKSQTVYNDMNNLIEQMSNKENYIYLPKKYWSVGNYSEVTISFKKENGIAHMALQNKYGSKDYKRYIYYEVLKNDLILLKEDVSNWNSPNYISIPGLKKGDQIKIRLVLRKEIKTTDSWEDAAKVQILYYEEISSKISSRRNINFSSPYSIEP